MSTVFQKIKLYISLVTFSHTIFALPFALIGFAMGFIKTPNFTSWNFLLYIILCMLFARNAAMSFNRFIDRNIDKKNLRTANREIPSGKIKPFHALIFSIINALLFIFTTYFINNLCFVLSPVALLVILGYSFTKRFAAICHLVLGIGLALAPIGAYIAVTSEFGLSPIFLSIAVLFWVSGFDIIYALQDVSFDKANKLHSIPVLIGIKSAIVLSAVFHFLTIIFIILTGISFNFSIFYWIGTLIFSVLLIYQHVIVKPNDFSHINKAFFTANGIASIIFAIFAITDIFLLH